MRETVRIEGTVETVVYQNEETGFTVFSMVEDDDEMDEITCVGGVSPLTPGERLIVTGSYVTNPRYGIQLNVEFYERAIPGTIQGIEKYLGSGVIKGVGERMARKITALFGEKTFEIIEQRPERLAEIKGVSLERAMSIGAAFAEQQGLRGTMMFLQEYGVSATFAMKIYKRFGAAAVDAVKLNPYCLAEEIYGIGFKTADEIASRLGVAYDSPFRARAGLRHILSEASGNGHVYLPKSLLLEEASALMGIPEEPLEEALSAMQYEGAIAVDKLENGGRAVYLSMYCNAEKAVAKKLLTLAEMTLDKREKIEEEIRSAEEQSGISLAREQKEAVEEALRNGVLVITGGPGTGKTTTINTIINIMRKDGLKVELTAPTGRAAKRMSEATGMEAKTIHRLLEIAYLSEDSSRQTFQRDESNPLETDALIVDESSMVDIMLMNSLLKAVAPGTRLILVGDVDQLPSVGPGNVLKDIINSGAVKVVRLTEIFRQAQESAIVMNAHRINRGEYPALNEKNSDFFFIKRV
ncbi:MAG: AAA family ATPase, partial [Defluviitaleaceae bacterium]|nr:AAA family ATPase [Defluviitaleaceae bacterium]